MAHEGGRVRRLIRHPLFLALLIPIVSLAACCGVLQVVMEATCTDSGIVYPHVGSRYYQAQVVSFDCGVLSDTVTRVELSTPKNDRIDGWYDRETVFTSGLYPNMITLNWESKDHLVIEYENVYWAHITKSLSNWHGVTITYRSQ